jgi:hypothetical protein
MNKLPKAVKQPDGALLIPAETATLLHRVLGDVWQTLAIYEDHHEVSKLELIAIDELQALLGPAGRLPTLAALLGVELPAKEWSRLTAVK